MPVSRISTTTAQCGDPITAAGAEQNYKFGYVLLNCTFIAGAGITRVQLGQPRLRPGQPRRLVPPAHRRRGRLHRAQRLLEVCDGSALRRQLAAPRSRGREQVISITTELFTAPQSGWRILSRNRCHAYPAGTDGLIACSDRPPKRAASARAGLRWSFADRGCRGA
jgi:hypothetical protein